MHHQTDSEQESQPKKLHLNTSILTLSRICLAFVVFVGHSASFTYDLDSVNSLLLASPTYAVYGFFFISGLVVSPSASRSLSRFSNSGSIFFGPLDYLKKRLLRIFPALFINLLLISFVLAPSFSFLMNWSYSLESAQSFFFKNLLLVPGWQVGISETLVDQPREGWNAPTWTLFFEILAYVAALLIALSPRRLRILSQICALSCSFLIVSLFNSGSLPIKGSLIPQLSIFLCFFFAGGLMSMITRKNQIRFTVLLISIGSLEIIFTDESKSLAVAICLLLFIGLSRFNPKSCITRIPDISYGTYLWHWPVLQITSALLLSEGRNISTLFFVSLPIVLVLSVLSWYLVEKPCIEFGRQHLFKRARLN